MFHKEQKAKWNRIDKNSKKKSLNDYFIIQNSKFSKWYGQRIFFKQTKIDLDSNETSQL